MFAILLNLPYHSQVMITITLTYNIKCVIWRWWW